MSSFRDLLCLVPPNACVSTSEYETSDAVLDVIACDDVSIFHLRRRKRQPLSATVVTPVDTLHDALQKLVSPYDRVIIVGGTRLTTVQRKGRPYTVATCSRVRDLLPLFATS